MMPPPFKGGQGRSVADARRSASALVWSAFLVVALVCAMWGAHR